MDFFDFGIYFAAVIIASVFVFWIVFILVRSLRPKKRTAKKTPARGKNAALKKLAQKSQAEETEAQTEKEFDENDIVLPEIPETAANTSETREPAVATAANPDTAATEEIQFEPAKTAESKPEVKPTTNAEIKPEQSPISAPGGFLQEQSQVTNNVSQGYDDPSVAAIQVTVKDDTGELKGEPPTVTEADNSEDEDKEEKEGNGDIFDVFDTELEEESTSTEFAAGLDEVDLNDIQKLSNDLHTILPVKAKGEDTGGGHKKNE